MKKALLIIATIILVVLIALDIVSIVLNATQKTENPIATIKFAGYEEAVVIELYPKYAENTVANFIALANNEFYNGLKIHRIEDSLIQGGDKEGTGSGSPKLSAINKEIEKESEEDKEYAIDGEFLKNGYDNPIRFDRGAIGMARGDYSQYGEGLLNKSYNSAGSQFFITTENLTSLNGSYCAFGKVISGMETVDAISKAERAVDESTDEETGEVSKTETTRPATDIIMESITVDTKGVDYGIPKTHDVFDFSSWYMSKYYSGSTSN